MTVIVTLGGVAFQDFEVPERIAFGGAQRVAVQRLIGGGRVVNVLGGDDGEIVFSGVFAGGDAAARAQALDATRVIGAAVPLVWDAFFYSVVVAEFAADYAKPWWIPFSVRCVVAGDPLADAVVTLATAATVVAGDIASALGLSGQAGVSLSGLAVPTAVGFALAQAGIRGGMAAAGVALSGGAAVLAGAVDAPAGVAGVSQVAAASANLAALGEMSGFVNRAAGNFASQLS